MTANDFFLLLIAFGGFVVAPALLLWGFSCLIRRKQGPTRGPDVRPDSPDARETKGARRTNNRARLPAPFIAPSICKASMNEVGAGFGRGLW